MEILPPEDVAASGMADFDMRLLRAAAAIDDNCCGICEESLSP
jgi:hypothetical protein